jgi:hypothetical protein
MLISLLNVTIILQKVWHSIINPVGILISNLTIISDEKFNNNSFCYKLYHNSNTNNFFFLNLNEIFLQHFLIILW